MADDPAKGLTPNNDPPIEGSPPKTEATPPAPKPGETPPASTATRKGRSDKGQPRPRRTPGGPTPSTPSPGPPMPPEVVTAIFSGPYTLLNGIYGNFWQLSPEEKIANAEMVKRLVLEYAEWFAKWGALLCVTLIHTNAIGRGFLLRGIKIKELKAKQNTKPNPGGGADNPTGKKPVGQDDTDRIPGAP